MFGSEAPGQAGRPVWGKATSIFTSKMVAFSLQHSANSSLWHFFLTWPPKEQAQIPILEASRDDEEEVGEWGEAQARLVELWPSECSLLLLLLFFALFSKPFRYWSGGHH